jgi:hypothetical protein
MKIVSIWGMGMGGISTIVEGLLAFQAEHSFVV